MKIDGIERFPIDGLLLTETELGLYLLGQLDVESHRKLRHITYPELPVLTEDDFPKPKPAKRSAPIPMSETKGIDL